MLKYNRLAIAFYIFCSSCASAKINTNEKESLPAAALKPYGRYVLHNKKDLELIGSAVHFGFSFQGKECKLFASIRDTTAHNYLQYELDGEYQNKIRISGNSSKPIVLTAQEERTHTVWVYKATEAHSGAIVIQKTTGKKCKATPKACGSFNRIYWQ